LVSQIKERNRILFYFEFYDENKNKLKWDVCKCLDTRPVWL
jgi:hypothetical protein